MGDKGPSSSFSFFKDEFDSDEGVRSDLSQPQHGLLSSESPFLLENTDEQSFSASIDGLSEGNQHEALRRLSYIQFIEKRNTSGWTEKNLKPLLQEAGKSLDGPVPSWRTLAGWHSSYKKSGRTIEALVPKHTKKGNRRKKVVDDAVYFWKAIKEKYLRRERPTIAATYEYYKDLITLANRDVVEGRIPALSLRAFYDRVAKLPPYEVTLGRYGQRYADREYRNVGAHSRPTRVLERVEIDHTPLDLILLDDKTGIPLGRPYLTALLDSFSGCVVGFYLGYKEPSYESVRKALLNALLNKAHIRELYPALKNDWPCEGKIETLVVDNGAEFWSKSLEYACQKVVTDVQYNPVGRPWLKPMVERFFGVVNKKLLVGIPGKTFSNIGELDGYNPQKDAVMRFSVFMDVFHRWVIDVYHQSANSRETNVPAVTWNMGVRELPPAVYRGSDIEILIIELGQSEQRTLKKGGITFERLQYSSDELLEYRKYNPPKSGRKLTMQIKINPEDLSSIYVYLDAKQQYIKVPCVDPDGYTNGLTLFQHRTYRRFVRNFYRSQVNHESLAEARLAIEERIGAEVKEVEKIGRNKNKPMSGAKAAARHLGIGSDKAAKSASLKRDDHENQSGVSNSSRPEARKSKNQHSDMLDDWDDMASDLDPY